ncbi:MAG TPA: aldehyde dehydrogenase family protein [Nitrososphaeraceae archaeon]|nr:aldehyde dehydrogenase family protein [Nitrososphaeraceae archaeon]
MIKFENEDTFGKFQGSGKEHDFHKKYEEAVKMARSQFGKKYTMLIDGRQVSSTKWFAHTSPIDTRLELGYFPRGELRHVQKAIGAANKAFENWRQTKYEDRVRIFRIAADSMAERKFELSAWITFENGKNRYEASADVDAAIDFISYYSLQMEQNDGFIVQTNSAYAEERSKSVMKPYGVWGIISPFNFPAALAVGMCTGALITGNTAVLKTASDTPLIGYIFTEIMKQSGLPDGALNFITGSGRTVGKAIIESKDVAGIAFTGSKEVGDTIISGSRKAKSRVITAELGGKNPAVVTETADINKAVEGIVKGAFSYSGQKCSATSRVYVDKKIKHEFTKKLVQKTKSLSIGDPVNPKTMVGPLINSNAYAKYKRFSKLAFHDGNVLTGGKVKNDGEFSHGYYVEPTIVDGLSKSSLLLREELFVPILCVIEYESFGKALEQCNETQYGLTAGIYSSNRKEIEAFFDSIEAGVVYANRSRGATTGAMVSCQSFGGWKASGTSGKGTGGPYYLTQFLREQSQTTATTKSR